MEPLSIDEILDETNQIDITARQKHWLTTEVSLCFFDMYLELSALKRHIFDVCTGFHS